MKRAIVYIAASLAATSLVGCTHALVQPKPALPDNAGAVTAIRALGAHYASSVQVFGLRDPVVDGFLDAAKTHEAHGHIHAAQVEVGKALQIAPHAPEILQYAAELAVEADDWKQAGALAQQSFDAGSKVGGLCARNLETLARSHTVRGDAEGAAATRAKIPACRVPPVARF